MTDLTFADIDHDGALQEAAEEVNGTRADFLRKTAIGGGALLGGGAILGALPSVALGAPPRSDVAILNFALTLEYLEAAFYTEAVQKGRLSGEAAKFASVVGKHERSHVNFLKAALGGNAVKRPKFNFRETTSDQAKFLETATALEDTGVMAYAGQGPLLKTKSIVAAALSIHSVEARHAAWVRDIRGNGSAPSPAPSAFDSPKTKRQILAAVKATGFIVS